jgi:hypothetical protein
MKNILEVGNTYQGKKSLVEPGLFVNFGQFPSLIRIRISNMDPDPGQQINAGPCGSGSTALN